MKRRAKPTEEFTGLTLDQWHADVNNITWVQQEPQFKRILSVVLNEARLAHEMAAGCSEARAFGRVEGYHQAIEVLRNLGRRPPKPEADPDANFDQRPERVWRETEPND